MKCLRLALAVMVAGLILPAASLYAGDADDYVKFFSGEVGQWKWTRPDGAEGMTYCRLSPTKRGLVYHVTKQGEPYLSGVAGYDAAAKGWKMVLLGVEQNGDTVYTSVAKVDKAVLTGDRQGATYTISDEYVSGDGDTESGTLKVIVHSEDSIEYVGPEGSLKSTRTTSFDHLKVLQPLIGTWVSEIEAADAAPGVEVGDKIESKFELAWDLDKSVISTHIKSTVNGMTTLEHRGTIAWNPGGESIFSRGFNASGGHGYSKWIRGGDNWNLIGYHITSDGVKTTNTIVISEVSEDSWVGQVTNRVQDGVPLEDRPKATWTRVK